MGSQLALLCGITMAVSMGMTAWRLVAATGKINTQVDVVLGGCLVTSGLLFAAALAPGSFIL